MAVRLRASRRWRNGSSDHPPSHLRDVKATPLSPLVQMRQSCPRCGHQVRRSGFSIRGGSSRERRRRRRAAERGAAARLAVVTSWF